jgi:hypothetical protein
MLLTIGNLPPNGEIGQAARRDLDRIDGELIATYPNDYPREDTISHA